MRFTARRLVAIAALALATFTATHAGGAAHSTVQAGGGHAGGCIVTLDAPQA